MTQDKLILDSTQTNKKEYAEHNVFDELERYIDFYDQFSFSIMHFVTMGTNSIINIDALIYSSIQGTLESVNHVLKNGRMGDAFALLRKYHDSVTINIYTNLYLEDNHSIESFTVQKITNWMEGKEQLPDYRQMSQYIRSSDRLKSITDLLDKDDSYKKTRDRCNDNLHYNFFNNFMINDNQVYLKNRISLLDAFEKDVRNIFVLHLSYMFYLKDYYMCASDYIDAIELGMKPEENSQYWVAPFVQEVFSDIIVRERADIANLIIKKTSMQLEEKQFANS